jgi:16S rRNA (uracil1498-N3)-methyltransferase
MSDRYFVDRPIDGPSAQLRGAEAHHLAHVMRARPGEQVVLFDGSGAEFRAQIDRLGRAEIDLTVLGRELVDREAGAAITLGVALPKGDRQRWLVEKSVELGVARLVPLSSERSVDRLSESSLERLRRAVIEASKQCGRNVLMEIAPPAEIGDYLRAASGDGLRWCAHPGARPLGELLDALPKPAAARPQVALAIGPEGGWTDAELEAASAAGWHAVGLGARTLRVETAALALVAVVLGRLD